MLEDDCYPILVRAFFKMAEALSERERSCVSSLFHGIRMNVDDIENDVKNRKFAGLSAGPFESLWFELLLEKTPLLPSLSAGDKPYKFSSCLTKRAKELTKHIFDGMDQSQLLNETEGFGKEEVRTLLKELVDAKDVWIEESKVWGFKATLIRVSNRDSAMVGFWGEPGRRYMPSPQGDVKKAWSFIADGMSVARYESLCEKANLKPLAIKNALDELIEKKIVTVEDEERKMPGPPMKRIRIVGRKT